MTQFARQVTALAKDGFTAAELKTLAQKAKANVSRTASTPGQAARQLAHYADVFEGRAKKTLAKAPALAKQMRQALGAKAAAPRAAASGANGGNDLAQVAAGLAQMQSMLLAQLQAAGLTPGTAQTPSTGGADAAAATGDAAPASVPSDDPIHKIVGRLFMPPNGMSTTSTAAGLTTTVTVDPSLLREAYGDAPDAAAQAAAALNRMAEGSDQYKQVFGTFTVVPQSPTLGAPSPFFG